MKSSYAKTSLIDTHTDAQLKKMEWYNGKSSAYPIQKTTKEPINKQTISNFIVLNSEK